MKKLLIASILQLSLVVMAYAQSKPGEYLKLRWGQVASQMPAAWYGTEEAQAVAENVLLCQRDIGGWAKNKPYHHVLTKEEKAQITKERSEVGATFDNGATITELKFLAKVYASLKDERYRTAFNKGLDYVFAAQYANGGWPQFFPHRSGTSVAYSSHITYNDDAMVNIMNFLKSLYTNEEGYKALQISAGTKDKAKKAFDKGVSCILASQIKDNGKLTVWCAQHDKNTLVPANARKYELASFSGSESVGITQLLMDISNPSKDVIASVKGAVAWFETHKVEGIRLERKTMENGKRNLVVVPDKSASVLWARFYDLKTHKPFFCDRDGIKKNSLAEIGYERRNGYGWYTDAPGKLLEAYPAWAQKWDIK